MSVYLKSKTLGTYKLSFENWTYNLTNPKGSEVCLVSAF